MLLPEERPIRSRSNAWLIVLAMLVVSATIIVSCMGSVYVFTTGGSKAKEMDVGQTSPGTEVVEVLLAAQEIPAGALLTRPESLFDRKSFPKGTEPLGAITDLDLLRDRFLVRKIEPGCPCTRKDLASNGAYIAHLPADLRAIGVRTTSDDNKLLLPGCRADVLARQRLKDGNIRHRILLENVLVLALERPEKPMDDNKGSDLAVQATLAVTADQAVKLADAMVDGPVRLIVHPPETKANQ